MAMIEQEVQEKMDRLVSDGVLKDIYDTTKDTIYPYFITGEGNPVYIKRAGDILDHAEAWVQKSKIARGLSIRNTQENLENQVGMNGRKPKKVLQVHELLKLLSWQTGATGFAGVVANKSTQPVTIKDIAFFLSDVVSAEYFEFYFLVILASGTRRKVFDIYEGLVDQCSKKFLSALETLIPESKTFFEDIHDRFLQTFKKIHLANRWLSIFDIDVPGYARNYLNKFEAYVKNQAGITKADHPALIEQFLVGYDVDLVLRQKGTSTFTRTGLLSSHQNRNSKPPQLLTRYFQKIVENLDGSDVLKRLRISEKEKKKLSYALIAYELFSEVLNILIEYYGSPSTEDSPETNKVVKVIFSLLSSALVDLKFSMEIFYPKSDVKFIEPNALLYEMKKILYAHRDSFVIHFESLIRDGSKKEEKDVSSGSRNETEISCGLGIPIIKVDATHASSVMLSAQLRAVSVELKEGLKTIDGQSHSHLLLIRFLDLGDKESIFSFFKFRSYLMAEGYSGSYFQIDWFARNEIGECIFTKIISTENAKILLSLFHKHGFPIDALYSGESLIQLASKQGNYEVVEFLRSQRINVDTPGNKGETPLFVAVKHVRVGVVEALLKTIPGGSLPANPNLVCGNEAVPLYIALMRYKSFESKGKEGEEAKSKMETIIKLLLKHGADPYFGNRNLISTVSLLKTGTYLGDLIAEHVQQKQKGQPKKEESHESPKKASTSLAFWKKTKRQLPTAAEVFGNDRTGDNVKPKARGIFRRGASESILPEVEGLSTPNTPTT